MEKGKCPKCNSKKLVETLNSKRCAKCGYEWNSRKNAQWMDFGVSSEDFVIV